MLKINSEYSKGILFVRINGNLNRRTSYKLSDFLVPTILKHKIKFLVCNLYNLESIDGIGIKSLERCSKAINVNSGLFQICDIPKELECKFKNVNIKKTLNEMTAIKKVNI